MSDQQLRITLFREGVDAGIWIGMVENVATSKGAGFRIETQDFGQATAMVEDVVGGGILIWRDRDFFHEAECTVKHDFDLRSLDELDFDADYRTRADGQKNMCKVPGCARRHQSRGLCNTCYSAWFSAGKPDMQHWIATQATTRRRCPRKATVSEGAPDPPSQPSAPANPQLTASRAAVAPIHDSRFPALRWLDVATLPAGTYAFMHMADHLFVVAEDGAVMAQVKVGAKR
jgi:hypothetical protein